MEEGILFTSDGFQLAGTIAGPDSGDPIAMVLLLVGSGQVDRDANTKRIRIGALKDIADYLAKQGIATFRYDKRGVGESEGDYWESGFHDHVRDAASAIGRLRNHPKLGRLRTFVAGHSEGALISTRIAAEDRCIAGAILIAGSAQTGEATIRWQAKEVAKGLGGFNAFVIRLFRVDLAKAQEKVLGKIKSSSKDWFRQGLIRKVNAKWFREFLAYDPAADLSRIEVPTLAITGSKDIQVNPADLKLMANLVKGDFECHEIPEMTHMLRKDKGDPSVRTYREQVKRPVEPQLLELVRDWIRRHAQG